MIRMDAIVLACSQMVDSSYTTGRQHANPAYCEGVAFSRPRKRIGPPLTHARGLNPEDVGRAAVPLDVGGEGGVLVGVILRPVISLTGQIVCQV